MTLVSRLVGRRFHLPPRRTARIVIEQRIAVPMRDGVVLLADRVYAPGDEAAPVVLMRSPYGRHALFGLIARLFAERGLQVVIQSCRGTFESGGAFDPMRQEQADGIDTIDWVRAQPWFPGRLYTYGVSYLGFAQWAVAKPAGEKVDAMALNVTLANFRDETLAFGGFTLEGSLTWTNMMNTPQKSGLSGLLQGLSTSRRAAQLSRLHNHLPLKDLDHLATGKRVSWWQDWIGHDDPEDPWWSAVDHSAAVADVTAPTTMIGGWRDIFLPHQIRDFEAMQAAGREVWLTIGPWTHADPAGMFEGVRQALALFAAAGEGKHQLESRNRVRLHVGGAETWREYSAWPPPGAREHRLYLQPEGRLAASAAQMTAASSIYTYNPADPTPSMHGPRLFGAAKRPDMAALQRRADVIAFSTPPLDADLEAIGPVSVQLYVRSNLNHTDFYVCVCDVDNAGRVLHVIDGYLRLRPGRPAADCANVKSIVLECWPTAYRFSAGHRIRLLVASGAHPRYVRNLGTGEPLGEGVSMLVAHQEILHDRAHPSTVVLTIAPVARGQDGGSVSAPAAVQE